MAKVLVVAEHANGQLNGSTAKHSTGGKEVTLDLPRDASEMARQPIGASQRQDNVSH